ncbi:MAG: hypothetical protein V1676_01755 [Candidatus Diapherotrites archaeon]
MSEHAAEAHGDAHAAEGKASGKGRVDGWVEKVLEYVTKQISSFVAFLFLLFSAGAVYGSVITARQHELGVWLLIAPAVLGLMAYYSRAFALAVFALLILLIIVF